MTIVSRDRIEIVVEGEVGGNEVDTNTVIIPDTEIWQIERITFADVKEPSNNWSGKFKVDFGAVGSRELIGAVFLFGSTIPLDIRRVFQGNGIKEIRIIRENLGNQAKEMFVFVEGFKRIGI